MYPNRDNKLRQGNMARARKKRRMLTRNFDISQGHEGEHDNRHANFAAALAVLGFPPLPAPLNLFMSVPWTADGTLSPAAVLAVGERGERGGLRDAVDRERRPYVPQGSHHLRGPIRYPIRSPARPRILENVRMTTTLPRLTKSSAVVPCKSSAKSI
jgi:hypothetical protein